MLKIYRFSRKCTNSTASGLSVLLLALFIFLSPWTRAVDDKVNFIAIDSPPYAYLLEGEPVGINIDWLNHIKQRLTFRSNTYVLPLKRAMHEVENSPTSVLVGLARTPEREAHFQWLTPMYDVEIGYVTNLAVSDTARAKHAYRAQYCVHAGSPMEAILLARGEQDVISLLNDELCLAMLEQNMVSVWFTAFNVAEYLSKQRTSPIQLAYGKKVQTVSLYMAAATSFSHVRAQALSDISKQLDKLRVAELSMLQL